MDMMEETAGMAVLIQETSDREKAREIENQRKPRNARPKSLQRKPTKLRSEHVLDVDPNHVDLLIIVSKPKRLRPPIFKNNQQEEKIGLKDITLEHQNI